jgi:hypothetical protein
MTAMRGRSAIPAANVAGLDRPPRSLPGQPHWCSYLRSMVDMAARIVRVWKGYGTADGVQRYCDDHFTKTVSPQLRPLSGFLGANVLARVRHRVAVDDLRRSLRPALTILYASESYVALVEDLERRALLVDWRTCSSTAGGASFATPRPSSSQRPTASARSTAPLAAPRPGGASPHRYGQQLRVRVPPAPCHNSADRG